MLATNESFKREFDIRWMFTSASRCHICGCQIVSGDEIQVGDTEEIYTLEEGSKIKNFRSQWHVHCSEEQSQQ